jgi:hypothetical protein
VGVNICSIFITCICVFHIYNMSRFGHMSIIDIVHRTI